MSQNQGIFIGINDYHFLQTLEYAQQDAEAIKSFLVNEVNFAKTFLCTNKSPITNDKQIVPFRSNLLRLIRQISDQPSMRSGDNFWFFFSGHGIRHNNQDYLMPLEGDPEDVEQTGIPTQYVIDRLQGCGADNIIFILDACRKGGQKSGQGIGQSTAEEACCRGVISIFSCSPEQYSYELPSLQQGVFTTALLEGLGTPGKCATVQRLNEYLKQRVPELVQQYLGNVKQLPYIAVEPIEKANFILIPKYAQPIDIALLKNSAYKAEVNGNLCKAEKLWIQILNAYSGTDLDAIEAIKRISGGKVKQKLEEVLNLLEATFDKAKLLAEDRNTYSGTIGILGPRCSGKQAYLASVTYFPKLVLNSPVKRVLPFGDDARSLIQNIEQTLLQGLDFSPSGSMYPYEIPDFSIQIECQPKVQLNQGDAVIISTFLKKIYSLLSKSIMLLSKVDIDVPLESDAEIFSELGFVGLLIWLIYAEREASENEFVATISETFDTPGNFKFPDTLRMNELINALQIPLGELEEVINLIKNPMGESLKYLIENIYQLLEEVFEERRKNLEKIPESLQVIATRLEEQILSNCNENIKLASNIKIFCGEVFEAMDQRDSESYFEDCINDITSSEFLLLLFNANLSKEDTSYANWVLGLQDKLSRLESHPSRLAVVFSHFDHPNIYSYRNNLNSLIAARFPATKLAIETWITDENSLAYFACSAFGMLNGTDKPNAIYRSSSTGGYLGSGTLKNPDIWQPFGVISPIYWILTGEYDERLLNF